MAFIVKNISVDVASKNVFKSVVAKQYDTDSRFLQVRLTNEGEQINVNPTSIVTINALRKDNKAKAFSGTINEDGTVTFPIANWILELDGQVKCDISVIDSEQRKLTSSTFVITVEAASCSSTDISEDENYDILVSLIDEVSKLEEASKTTVDSELSSESENPVQNKVIKAALNSKLSNSVGSVKGANLADGCIECNHIGDGQVTATAIAENSIYTRHIADENISKEKLSSELQSAIGTIGAIKVDMLNVDTASDGLYVTNGISGGKGLYNYIYSNSILVVISTLTIFQKEIIIIDHTGIYKLSAGGKEIPYFSTTISETGMNAPTSSAVYKAIQDALYIDTDEVIA